MTDLIGIDDFIWHINTTKVEKVKKGDLNQNSEEQHFESVES